MNLLPFFFRPSNKRQIVVKAEEEEEKIPLEGEFTLETSIRELG